MRLRSTGAASLMGAQRVTQASHGFTVGTVVRHDGDEWVKAQADSAANAGDARSTAVVASVSGDVFVPVFIGAVNWPGHGHPIGAELVLSPSTAGAMTDAAPASGQVRLPVATVLSEGRIFVRVANGYVVE